MNKWMQIVMTLLVFAFFCCSSETSNAEQENSEISSSDFAAVTKVGFNGDESNYTFSVTISSPDLGCNQYADWWEILDLEGNLIYRRILAHSHVNEQPFTRSGGSVNLTADTQVYIRAHMNNTGYSTKAMKGSVNGDFITSNLDVNFAKDLESQEPLPNGCAF